MLGTAFPAGRVLLVEQPGPWGRDGLRDSNFDRAVAVAVQERAAQAGMRVQAIRRPGRSPRELVRSWAVLDCRPGHERSSWGTFDADAELLDLALDGSAGVDSERLTYLVCAHSKHDTCCALRGRPVAAALAAERPGQVWECSHLGGERFAANVLVAPLGLLYGRVLPGAAREFVETCEAGEVVPDRLRGHVGLPSVAQAALAYGFEHLGLRRADALVVESCGEIRDGAAVVRLRAPHGLLDVTVRVESVAADGMSCANPSPSSYLRYHPVTVTAVPA
jgi:hypothetical protein